MIRIVDGFQKLFVSGSTSDVFRWSLVYSIQTHRWFFFVYLRDLLHRDFVTPAVTEVANVPNRSGFWK
jgi:hypothetical protein